VNTERVKMRHSKDEDAATPLHFVASMGHRAAPELLLAGLELV